MQELQLPLLQDVQPDDLPLKGFWTPLIPNAESFFVTSSAEHFGQTTRVLP